MNELMNQGREDPGRALAALYWRLYTDTPLRTTSGLAANTERAKQLLSILRTGSSCAPIRDADAFCLLWALDQFLADQAVGSAPQVALIDDHSPPLSVAARPRDWSPTLAGGTDQLGRWMQLHAVSPRWHKGVEVRLVVAPASVCAGWDRRDRLMVASFDDGSQPDNLEKLPRFYSHVLKNPELRRASLPDLFAAMRDPLLALVLPELSLCPVLLPEFLDGLVEMETPPLLTVPGSYHQESGGKRTHTAILVDDTGTRLLTQHKIQPLCVEWCQEEIEPGVAFELLVGPWGVLALPICRDFCEQQQDLWEVLGPDLVLVPSMGNAATMRAHERRSKNLHISATTTVCMANQPVGDWGSDPARRGMVAVSGKTIWLEQTASEVCVHTLCVDLTGAEQP